MTRFLKLLGLATVSALVISSVMASLASGDDLTAESVPVQVTGLNDNGVEELLTLQGGILKCKTSTINTTTTVQGDTTVTLTPAYDGCAYAGLAATFTMNGCDYLLHVGSGTEATTGKIDVVCPSGKEITITAPSVGTAKCIVHIPPQVGLSKLELTNVGIGTTREITSHNEISGITYSQTKGTAETGNCLTEDGKNNGTLVGKTLFTGEEDGVASPKHIGIFLS